MMVTRAKSNPTRTSSRANGKARPLAITKREGRRMLEEEARRSLGMSADEFIEAWEGGRLDARADEPEVSRIAMLLPLAR
jgi:hypothetical protein